MEYANQRWCTSGWRPMIASRAAVWRTHLRTRSASHVAHRSPEVLKISLQPVLQILGHGFHVEIPRWKDAASVVGIPSSFLKNEVQAWLYENKSSLLTPLENEGDSMAVVASYYRCPNAPVVLSKLVVISETSRLIFLSTYLLVIKYFVTMSRGECRFLCWRTVGWWWWRKETEFVEVADGDKHDLPPQNLAHKIVPLFFPWTLVFRR